jgi:hypothetical protein
MRRAALIASLSLLCAVTVVAQTREPDKVKLVPQESVDWGLRNVGAGFTAVFGMYNYWYKDNSVRIETVPADARIQLYYIRSNFQKLFVRAESPVEVQLPPRIQTTPKDVMIVRVAANGFKTRESTFRVGDVPDKLVFQLAALPNSLTFLGHTHLAGRTSLSLRTTKEADFRVIKSRSFPGFTLSLSETADALAGSEPPSGGLVALTEVSQLGEDLVVRIETRGHDFEVRSKHSYDAIRDEHVYTFDMTAKGTRIPSFDQVRRELDGVHYSPSDPCDRTFEAALREQLEAEQIARALRPSGSIADLYRKEAMKRLGRLDRGSVQTLSGETLRTGSPIELEMALQSAGSVNGYLGLLGAFSRTRADPELALRSLIAPELSAGEFGEIYRVAHTAWSSCRR